MKHKLEFFPDGTPIDDWFYDTTAPELSSLGKPYLLTDYGILPDGQLHTCWSSRLASTTRVRCTSNRA